VKLTSRIKAAYNILTNKSGKEIETQQLLDFLGLRGTKEKALSEATYFACLKVLSESVGKLPLKLLRHQENNGVITARQHVLYSTLHDRPNPYMTSTVFWSTIEQNRNHFGNAYALIKGAGSKMSLWILPSDEVEIWYDDKKILSDIPDIYYMYSHGGKIYQFSSEQILHFKTSNTFDGIKGIAVKEQLKITIEGNIKAQKMLNNMYKSGFTAKAVVQYTSDLSEKNLTKFKEKIEKFAGSDLDDKETKNIIPIPIGTSLTPLNIKLAEYRGYLMCLLDSKIFLADSRNLFERTSGKVEYEWFYWELPFGINYFTEYQGDLYLANTDGQIFILEGTTDNEVNIYSKWTTTKDTFGYDSYRKITNKRGGTASVKEKNNDSINLKTITEIRSNNIGSYNDSKGYLVYRIKEKKFKWIQLEFSSNKPFGLFSCTLEAFIGGYVKR